MEESLPRPAASKGAGLQHGATAVSMEPIPALPAQRLRAL